MDLWKQKLADALQQAEKKRGAYARMLEDLCQAYRELDPKVELIVQAGSAHRFALTWALVMGPRYRPWDQRTLLQLELQLQGLSVTAVRETHSGERCLCGTEFLHHAAPDRFRDWFLGFVESDFFVARQQECHALWDRPVDATLVSAGFPEDTLTVQLDRDARLLAYTVGLSATEEAPVALPMTRYWSGTTHPPTKRYTTLRLGENLWQVVSWTEASTERAGKREGVALVCRKTMPRT